MTALTLTYFYDPLCGWCYASAPALAEVAQRDGIDLRMMPSGLFADANARPVASMAQHAWTNDMRIRQMTGQEFTTVYRDRVLMKPDGRFDSGHATRAIILAGDGDARVEAALLHRLQIARYVEGRDTSTLSEVLAITRDVLTALGRSSTGLDPLRHGDVGLHRRAVDRVAASQREMAALGISGVPQMVATHGDTRHLLPSAALYGGASAIRQALAELAG